MCDKTCQMKIYQITYDHHSDDSVACKSTPSSLSLCFLSNDLQRQNTHTRMDPKG